MLVWDARPVWVGHSCPTPLTLVFSLTSWQGINATQAS